MLNQQQLVRMSSVPLLRYIVRGSRLMKNAILTCITAISSGDLVLMDLCTKVINTGIIKTTKIRIIQQVMTIELAFIATTWSCTKSFWFLRPVDELLSFRSDRLNESVSELQNLTGVAKFSRLRSRTASLGWQKGFNLCF